MKTVSIATIGCKVNQFESEALRAQLEEQGYNLVPFESGADISIINTCTVTHRADFDSRQMVRKALRKNPDTLVIVTGCYSQVAPEDFARMEGVAYLLGNREKKRIPTLLPLMVRGEFPKIQVSDIHEEKTFVEMPVQTFHQHTRAFLKIQDGCNSHCSYCIVPQARGPSRSLSLTKIMDHLKHLKESGYKEVVLTGIHIGSYGWDLQPPCSLKTLLQQIEIGNTPDRIRLSSIEPLDFSEDLVRILSHSIKICPHLHIPIQSADDEILRRMGRGYGQSFLRDLIGQLVQAIPDVSIGADLMVGFPGETEERFNNTYQFIASLPISYLHVFPFSRRKGTLAAQFVEQIDSREIRQRAERMRELGRQKRRAFYRQFVGRTLDILVEDRREKGSNRWRGLSRHYVPVYLLNGLDLTLANQEKNVKVTAWNDQGVFGQLVEGLNG